MNNRTIFLAVTFIASAPQSQACSVCIAHMLGAALHGIGAQVLPKGKLVVGVSHLTFQKSNASESPGIREFETYKETSIGLAYGLTDQILLSADVPFVDKTIRADGESESARGLGDASIGLIVQRKPDDKQPFLFAGGVSVKLPTGANNKRDASGNLLEEHLQPGTGSTDIAFGVAFTKESHGFGSGLWYGGLQARINGRNSRGMQYGNALFYNFGYSHPIGKKAHASLELVGRFAQKDHASGVADDNSGGHLLYLGAGLQAPLGEQFSVGIGWQLPILERLNGDQTERGVFSIGIAGRF